MASAAFLTQPPAMGAAEPGDWPAARPPVMPAARAECTPLVVSTQPHAQHRPAPPPPLTAGRPAPPRHRAAPGPPGGQTTRSQQEARVLRQRIRDRWRAPDANAAACNAAETEAAEMAAAAVREFEAQSQRLRAMSKTPSAAPPPPADVPQALPVRHQLSGASTNGPPPSLPSDGGAWTRRVAPSKSAAAARGGGASGRVAHIVSQKETLTLNTAANVYPVTVYGLRSPHASIHPYSLLSAASVCNSAARARHKDSQRRNTLARSSAWVRLAYSTRRPHTGQNRL